MRRIPVFIGAYLILTLSCFSAFGQDFQIVRDGVEYAKVTKQSKAADGKDENVVINLLRLDLTKVRLGVAHALDAAIGLEKTSSIASRHGAFAAINAGFFRIDQSIYEGDDVGALMIDGKLLSEATNNRTALLISNTLKKVQTSFQKLPDDFSVAFKIWGHTNSIDFSGINRERKDNDLILYTPEFHRTTLTNNDGIEVVINNNKVINVISDAGSNVIPSNGFILSASGNKRELIKNLKIGTMIIVGAIAPYIHLEDGDIVAKDIVSGVPQLIKNGKADVTWQEEKSSKSFVETHHPRTAIAKLKDGKFLMVTIDGRSEESGGMSLYQLADFLLEQGATDAMNLDGGGSSTMFLDGKVVNHPSDKEGERKVGDALLVFPR